MSKKREANNRNAPTIETHNKVLESRYSGSGFTLYA